MDREKYTKRRTKGQAKREEGVEVNIDFVERCKNREIDPRRETDINRIIGEKSQTDRQTERQKKNK